MKTDQKETIRQFNGRIVGYIETNTKTGEAQARDFYGRIIGFFDPTYAKYRGGNGCTRDFYGRIIGYGNMLHGIVWNPKYNKCIDVDNLDR